MTRPEVGQVAEWVEGKAAIKPLLALRWCVERGRITEWPEPVSAPLVFIPRWEEGGLREVTEC